MASLAAGQPGEPAGQVPVAVAEQGHGGGHQHPAHHGGVDQDRRRQATPNILNSITESVAKCENTATMITAALVTTPALAPIPPMIASLVGVPGAAAHGCG